MCIRVERTVYAADWRRTVTISKDPRDSHYCLEIGDGDGGTVWMSAVETAALLAAIQAVLVIAYDETGAF